MRKHIRDILIYNAVFFTFYKMIRSLHLFFTNKRKSDRKYLEEKFYRLQGYKLDLDNPRTLNEKLQWLKLFDRQDFHSIHADKYAARDYIASTFGEEYLIPLEFETKNVKDLVPENFPDYPVIVKTNHGFGSYKIIRDKSTVDWKKLRMDFKRWLSINYYYFEREWQYKNIEPRIIVEKLLLTNLGRLPNDYKLNFIQGKLEFIYVSVDREGTNKRNIYNAEWQPMHFSWARKGKDLSAIRGDEIEPPKSLERMIEFGTEVAKQYKYVRVDFYDIDGTLYFGEITKCHGGGFDQLQPFEYDQMFGDKMIL